MAMLGSLYFSEIAKYPPCTLCWYQRICMYPLVVLFMVGLIRRDKGVWSYGVPLAVIGWMIAAYHNLLYWKILPESEATCQLGVSCTTTYISYFGFITIPLLSWTAFTVILGCWWLFRRANRHEKNAQDEA